MEEQLIEPKVEFLLTPAQAQLLLAGISSGMINLESLQKSLSIIFGDQSGEETTTSMLKGLSEIGGVVSKSIKDYYEKHQKEAVETKIKSLKKA